MRNKIMASIAKQLSEREIQEEYNISVRTLQGWRRRKKGPPYRKVGGTLVRYDRAQFGDRRRRKRPADGRLQGQGIHARLPSRHRRGVANDRTAGPRAPGRRGAGPVEDPYRGRDHGSRDAGGHDPSATVDP